MQTPLFCGQAFKAGTVFFFVWAFRPLRISWFMVGIKPFVKKNYALWAKKTPLDEKRGQKHLLQALRPLMDQIIWPWVHLGKVLIVRKRPKSATIKVTPRERPNSDA
jgi:hypothetical protein